MTHVKTEAQIKGIREACRLAASTLRYLGPLIRPGIRTTEINAAAHEYICDHGARPACLNYRYQDFPPFPGSVCVSVNEEICHGIPGVRQVQDGDLVKVDVNLELNGFYGDTCKTFPVGTLSLEAYRLMLVAKMALRLGIEEVGPYKPLNNIGGVIGAFVLRNGCSVVTQFCGHGVGLELHEPPQIMHISTYRSGPLMLPGHVFTVEPMINAGVHEAIFLEDRWTARTADGGWSAQYEHTVLVTQTGYEILTLVDGEEP